jgi:hypothetical protein
LSFCYFYRKNKKNNKILKKWREKEKIKTKKRSGGGACFSFSKKSELSL